MTYSSFLLNDMNYIPVAYRHLSPHFEASIARATIRILAFLGIFIFILSIPYVFIPIPENGPSPAPYLSILNVLSILICGLLLVPLWPRFPNQHIQLLYTVFLTVQTAISIPLYVVFPVFSDVFTVNVFMMGAGLFVYSSEKWHTASLAILFIGTALTPISHTLGYTTSDIGYILGLGLISLFAVFIHKRILSFRWSQFLQQYQIEQLNAELKLRTAELDAFARTVAHNLKTPFNGIIGYSEMLQETLVEKNIYQDAEINELLTNITSLGRSGYRIVDELLLLSATRKEDVRTQHVDMGTIIDTTINRLQNEIQTSQATFDYVDNYPTVIGHAPWLEEVWANYISNAIKYGGEPPHIQFGYEPATNNKIRFWIKDNGRGLTADQQERLFVEFSRLADFDVAIKGHGLGLSIVRRIIAKLDGEIGVESEIGQGSTFFFTLPTIDPAS